MKAVQHFRTITKHKILVMKECFRVGLYRQGLLHDMSKYGWTEFRVGCKYYQGTRSPNNAEREATGYSRAWLHHKGRNKHHYEYWIDYTSDKNTVFAGMKMPEKYVAEMFCDRVAASKTYNKEKYTDADALNYFLKGKSHLMHPETEELLMKLLVMLKDEGEDVVFEYMRMEVLGKKKKD